MKSQHEHFNSQIDCAIITLKSAKLIFENGQDRCAYRVEQELMRAKQFINEAWEASQEVENSS